eukprot:scaffold3438_cov62-Phaeocystis_antarctica.AAC.5
MKTVGMVLALSGGGGGCGGGSATAAAANGVGSVAPRSNCFSAASTSATSFWPLPLRLTRMASEGALLSASRMAWYTACAGSSAGKMPSSSTSAWKPAHALASLTCTRQAHIGSSV